MIYELEGKIQKIKDESIILKVNGISYEIYLPAITLENLKKQFDKNKSITAHFFVVHFIETKSTIGNQFPRLFGFETESERDFFLLLTTVDGLGFRTALKSLKIPTSNIAKAIEQDDILTLKSLPNIGHQTAKKIILQLKGKVLKFILEKDKDLESIQTEAIEVLKKLQFPETEIINVVNDILTTQKVKTPQEVVKIALQRNLTKKYK